MALPNFLCVGTSRAGTTSLHDILIQHPDIFLPEMKEAHFFDIEENYRRGIEWYEKEIFGAWQGQQCIGEITPGYMLCPQAAERIHTCLGDQIKLIFFLRNPADRAISHYRMNVGRGLEDLSFTEAVALESTRMAGGIRNLRRYSYLDTGRYARQIERFLRYVPRENMFFVLFESDFVRNRSQTLERITHFLGLQRFDFELDIRSNVSGANRYSRLTRFLHRDSRLKQRLRGLLPYTIRQNMRRVLMRLNHGSGPPSPSTLLASLPERGHLYQKYFSDQTLPLERLIGRSLDVWNSDCR